MAILSTGTAIRNSIAAIVRAVRIARDLDAARAHVIARELRFAAEEVEAEARRRECCERSAS